MPHDLPSDSPPLPTDGALAAGSADGLADAHAPLAADLRDWLRLLLTIGMGHEHTHSLLRHFGAPTAIFAAPPSALRPLVGEQRAIALQQEPPELERDWQRLQTWLQGAPDRRVLTLADAAYPQALLALHDAPILLFCMGRMPLARLDHGMGLAVVGSRNPTPQGVIHARSFAQYFAQQGQLVVSGLATGIDAAAHEGALNGSSADIGVTIAVTGTGLDRVYPKQNHVLAHNISQQGLLISEFTPGTPPLPHHFPRRNRLIAALSRGCLVVEATRQSGSLITARLCAEMGREVYALPGSIHAPQSQGCHYLIKEGARLVESAAEVLDDLYPTSLTPLALAQQKKALQAAKLKSAAKSTDRSDSPATTDPATPPSSPSLWDTLQNEQNQILSALGHEPCSLDQLQQRTGLSTALLQATLFELELGAQVTRHEGGRFQRLVHL